jgi:hypothetical protein
VKILPRLENPPDHPLGTFFTDKEFVGSIIPVSFARNGWTPAGGGPDDASTAGGGLIDWGKMTLHFLAPPRKWNVAGAPETKLTVKQFTLLTFGAGLLPWPSSPSDVQGFERVPPFPGPLHSAIKCRQGDDGHYEWGISGSGLFAHRLENAKTVRDLLSLFCDETSTATFDTHARQRLLLYFRNNWCESRVWAKGGAGAVGVPGAQAPAPQEVVFPGTFKAPVPSDKSDFAAMLAPLDRLSMRSDMAANPHTFFATRKDESILGGTLLRTDDRFRDALLEPAVANWLYRLILKDERHLMLSALNPVGCALALALASLGLFLHMGELWRVHQNMTALDDARASLSAQKVPGIALGDLGTKLHPDVFSFILEATPALLEHIPAAGHRRREDSGGGGGAGAAAGVHTGGAGAGGGGGYPILSSPDVDTEMWAAVAESWISSGQEREAGPSVPTLQQEREAGPPVPTLGVFVRHLQQLFLDSGYVEEFLPRLHGALGRVDEWVYTRSSAAAHAAHAAHSGGKRPRASSAGGASVSASSSLSTNLSGKSEESPTISAFFKHVRAVHHRARPRPPPFSSINTRHNPRRPIPRTMLAAGTGSPSFLLN